MVFGAYAIAPHANFLPVLTFGVKWFEIFKEFIPFCGDYILNG